MAPAPLPGVAPETLPPAIVPFLWCGEKGEDFGLDPYVILGASLSFNRMVVGTVIGVDTEPGGQREPHPLRGRPRHLFVHKFIDGVHTESEGVEPQRHVVVLPG